MGIKQTGKFCRKCNKSSMATGKTPNHILHLILSFFSGGVWLMVWVILVILSAGGYRCNVCGSKV